ncbi:MAG TPA: protein-glutamine glutaminase family protein [Candidatus Angelobacter sp.]|nr:protein-glutamine glutaminase family protein [Candidatus Angelobacter sp.]
MPNPNALVGLVGRIDPPVEKLSVTEYLRKYPGGVAVVLEGEQTARLLPGDRTAGMLEILEQLRQLRAPVYLEVRPESKEITRLLIPLVTRVSNVSESGADFEVDLQASHARHQVKRKNPDFAQLLETLRAAREKNATLIVTEADDHEIIDARPSEVESNLRPGAIPTPGKEGPGWFRRLCRRWFGCLCCVTPKRAQELFDLCSATTCNPLTVPAPCIPFLYPDDGCWARAHEMCRLMIAAGAKPRKVWIDGKLRVNTKNNPNCFVKWGWHVAPIICVRRRRFGQSENMVIDPSLFTTPVTEATWKGVQGDPNATLTETAASVYWRNAIPTDPNYVDTNFRLAFYRLQLKNRSLQFGPPPYAFCP